MGKEYTIISTIDVEYSDFGIIKTDIQIPGWETNTQIQTALQQITQAAFELGKDIKEIKIIV